jgi:phosphatidylglycerophosphate synthase
MFFLSAMFALMVSAKPLPVNWPQLILSLLFFTQGMDCQCADAMKAPIYYNDAEDCLEVVNTTSA